MEGGGYVARNEGAIVIGALLGDGDLLTDARRLAEAARSLDGTTRRIGGQLRANAAGYISAVGKSVRAVETLRDEQLAWFGETARAWESARTRLNGMSAALYDLKRSMRDAFVPIATAAAPALTTLTNLLARAVSGVGAFMAALTGQNAFIRATGDQRAYAGSLRRTTGAARALERQLASFDQLDILRDSRKGSGGSSFGGGAAEAAMGRISLVPVDAQIVAFGQRLRALFEAGDYDGVGRALADGLNGAIEKARALIRWENVGASVTRVVDGFCGAFNGLVDGVRWTDVGGALGDGIDTVLRSANRLLRGLDFARIGQAVGEGLNGAIREIDFDVLGDTLGRLLTVKLAMLANAAATFEWPALGEGLAKGLGGALRSAGEVLDGIDWPDVARSMTRGLNRFIAGTDWDAMGAFMGKRLSDALGALRAAVTEFDWGAAGSALSRAVNGLVKKIDWAALGQWLDRTIKGVLDFGIRFVEGFDADGFGEGLGKALDEVDWDGIAEKLWRLLSSAMGKLGGLGKLLGLDGGMDGLTLGGRRADTVVGVSLVKRGWSSIEGFVGTAVKVFTTLGRANWRTISDYVGTSVNVATRLFKSGWTSLTGFVGERVTAAVSLARQGWTSLSGFVGDALAVRTSLVKSGWTSLSAFVGDSLSVRTALIKNGWTTLTRFVGDSVSVRASLVKSGWSSIDAFVGTRVGVNTSLIKSGWSSIGAFVGTRVDVNTSLVKSGWTSLSAFVGTAVSVATRLSKWGWSSIEDYVGDDVTVWTQLAKWGWSNISDFVGGFMTTWVALRKNGWSSIADFVGTNVTTTVTLAVDKVSKVSAAIAKAFGLATGGVITAGGNIMRFAAGGAIMDGGRASWWSGVRKYAGGTGRAHGSLFVAGEAGPEVVGHVNGRTEILNRSQIAQAIYGAVVAGSAQAANALGRFLAGCMASCTNALIGSVLAVGAPEADAAVMKRLAAIEGTVRMTPPVAATGAVTPYEAARRGEGDAALRSALDANNADLIQTIIRVIGAQTSAIVQAVNGLRGGRGEGGMSAQRIIDEINRRTQMYSASPIRGM